MKDHGTVNENFWTVWVLQLACRVVHPTAANSSLPRPSITTYFTWYSLKNFRYRPYDQKDTTRLSSEGVVGGTQVVILPGRTAVILIQIGTASGLNERLDYED